MRGHLTSMRTATGALGAVTLLAFLLLWLRSTSETPLSALGNLDVTGFQRIIQDFRDNPSQLVAAPLAWLRDQHAHAPTLVFGLFAVLSVPLVATFCGLTRALHVWMHGKNKVRGMHPHEPYARQAGANLSINPDPYVPRHAALDVFEGLGDQNLRRIVISGPVIQIGRSDDVDIRLNDETVHRYHAAIERKDDCGYQIVDLSYGTGNGVVVNGRPTLSHALHDGDEIRIGRTKLRFATRLI